MALVTMLFASVKDDEVTGTFYEYCG